MLKAILFDVDETLLDWSGFNGIWRDVEAPHLEGVFRYLATQVHPGLGDDAGRYATEYMRRVHEAWSTGRSSLRSPHVGRLLVDTAIALGAPDHVVDMEQCLLAYGWRPAPGTCVFPDVPPVLETLRARGLRMGLVTNSFHPISLRDIELREHGLFDFFSDCRICAADVGYLKPHPSIFKAALDRLGVTADETVFVGDNLTADIAGAQSAGMHAILRVKKPPVPMLSGLVMPDAAINSFDELLGVLEKLYPDWTAQPSTTPTDSTGE